MRRIGPTGIIWDDREDAEKLKDDIDKKISPLNKNISINQAKLDKED